MNNKTLAEKISERITQQHLCMRPRAYFIAGSILLGAGLVATLLVAIFFVGVIVFRLRVNGAFTYLNGQGGWAPFIDNVPWIPLAIALVGIGSGILIMKKFEFSYKHAFLGIAGGAVLSIGILGIVIDTVGLPEQAEDITPLRPLLHMRYSNDSWIAGTVIWINPNDLGVGTPSGTSFTVIYTPDTTIIPDTPMMNGEWVRVIGEQNNNIFNADEIMHQPTPRHNPGKLPINRGGVFKYEYKIDD
ncbi:MAG: hypothetical protein COT25_02755 [Candidatus Kerfeldbacteria bacterium CG08_land_8_20_14_0_20_42_7]|uniref:Uncharacterized protein n=1 Tax=Candidatus Kerfeldbacteria bacterium CG08_land_8_20_14_0_20_42_7 TaxID=2014245 RepID=A0A2H0YUT1_9BACT|nr:MAG: hypothetical protein COT25_02755 [Candidatus Kerfeldbacteria bacterium CG08_land_8_20_14_0_20_42_7]